MIAYLFALVLGCTALGWASFEMAGESCAKKRGLVKVGRFFGFIFFALALSGAYLAGAS